MMMKSTLTLLHNPESANPDDLASHLLCETRDTRGALRSWAICGGNPSAFFEKEMGLGDKASYLQHRDLLKRYLRVFSAHQRSLSRLMRIAGGNSDAQRRHAQGAALVTRLIEVRRAGKAWSLVRAKSSSEGMAA